MTDPCLLQLRGLLVQLDNGNRGAGAEGASRLCEELLELGQRWPDKPPQDEAKVFERFGKQLLKLPDGPQRDIVAAFRPLREDVRRRMEESTSAMNLWLAEEGADPKRLVEVLQAIDGPPQMRWYKQCAEVDTKVRFLVAIASVLRAVHGETAPLRAHIGTNTQAQALAQQLASSYFVVPAQGSVLGVWHDGRLRRYNAALWRAAKCAAEQLKDDLQVRLVTALRRKATPIKQTESPRPKLELELREWPMAGCPLARAFLEFIAQRGHELGDLGRPSVAECPPHSLWPKTLRRLLERLDAFDVFDSEEPTNAASNGGPTAPRPGVVRLRWEAVTALAFKALGTKPKASSVVGHAGKVLAPEAMSSSTEKVPTPRPDPAKPALVTSTPPVVASPSAPVAVSSETPAPKLVRRKLDWGDARALQRLIRRGLRAKDEDWRRSWHQFCKQRRLSIEFSGNAQGGLAPPSKGALQEFVERNLSTLLKKEWAQDLMYRTEGQGDKLPPDSEGEVAENGAPAARAVGASCGSDGDLAGMAGAVKGIAPKVEAPKAAATTAARKRPSEQTRGSSSNSDSSRSKKQRKKIHRRQKKPLGMLGYGDYFGRGQGDMHISPEVMMMNQMMGMSMMMNNPLAMMGMGAPIMPPGMPILPTAAGMKMKKDDKSKKGKAEDKLKKDARDRERERKERERTEGQKEVLGGRDVKMQPKDVKSDWSKRREAMIDADDL